MQKPDLKDFTLDQLTDFVVDLGLKPFRAKQIFAWLYRPGITDFSQMTDIAKDVRPLLAEKAYFSRFTPLKEEKSEDGTIKYAFELDDGAIIESVVIPDENKRNTLCVSSQVGCAMQCGFCLTGTMGIKRNLRPAEIVNQVSAVIEIMANEGEDNRLNNLVFMGMGEPLANFDNLITALKILIEQRGHNFSSRRITVSTCGLVPKIKALGEEVPVNLAISLHAADDETRSKLMPINDTYPIDEVLQACREFPLPNRRRIMIEYILIKDVNDSLAHAKRLVKKLHGINCKINLLPYNTNDAFSYEPPSDETVRAFQEVLKKAGYTALLRTSRGSDISAACGQLAVQD